MSTTRNITIEQGETYSQSFTIFQSDGTTPVDITGATIRSQIRIRYGDTSPIATLVVSNRDDVNGKFTLSLSAATTASLDFLTGLYDIEVEYTNGDVRRYIKGVVIMDREVTK